jgi:phosphopantothenoylcysteine decarboxylase/phosphopantothenate--cysteine ligase
MGFAVAEAAALRGAEVTLISGPNSLTPFDGISYIEIQTCDQMAEAVERALPDQDIVVMAAAVADFKPAAYSAQKLKKNNFVASIELERTKDILKAIGSNKKEKFLVGFAVETERGIESAHQKLRDKNLDFIVLNNPLESGAGFRSDTNIVTIIDNSGNIEQLPQMSKSQVAAKIMDKIIKNFA